MQSNVEKTLQEIMTANGLNKTSILFRYTNSKYLETDKKDCLFVNAKPKPEEIVIDNYKGQGHAKMATDIGYGLAFTTQKESDYDLDEKVCIKVQLKDVLDMGGLIYPVTSVPEYINAFLLTIPEGKIKVELA